SAEQAFDISGIRAGALEAGVDEVVNWENDEYLDVEIPNPRSIVKAKLPRSVLEADRLIHIPKMKNNSMQLVSLGIKGWLGLLAYQDRYLYHRTDADIAFATCDLAKAIKDKHCLTLIDGITGLMGGYTCRQSLQSVPLDRLRRYGRGQRRMLRCHGLPPARGGHNPGGHERRHRNGRAY
ncbi:MAG: DUF362 domain-containing protein, partial [Desulfatiglandales bacterium]|nr:DUF362 domain-containing protein [Desulfatiglandales bacterium]